MAEKDYAETLFQAIDLLVNKRIESVKFDETIDAVVVDASKASSGQYVVSTGNAKFVAYSLETTYKNNDAVMVTIPQGNYDNQKMIIGKAVDNTNTPMIYKSPFQQLVNVSNNLIQGHQEIGFWANYTSPLKGRYWNIDNPDFKSSVAYQYTEQDGNTITTVLNSFWDSGDIFEQGFSQLGLQAQFSTWLGEYGTAFGNYGLAVELTFKCIDIPDPETANDPLNTFTNILTFDSSEFFGDAYNFETYYTQENVYDISDFLEYPIVRIRLFVYQRGNFKNTNGEYIYTVTPGEEEDDFSSIGANIFVKDPYICLGVSAADFQKDTLTLLTDSSLTYYKEVKKISDDPVEYETVQERDENNKKTICARWIHRDVEEDVIAAVQNNELPPGYEVRWYRFKLGAPSADLFSGAHWERFYGWKDSPDEETWDYAITQDEIDNHLADDIATNNLEIQFIPNVNYETEKLKAIVLRNERTDLEPIFRLVAASNIIEFTNDDDVRSEATLVDANVLSIRYDDDEKGHYFLYNEAGDIGKNEDGEVRTLTAVFDEGTQNVYEKAELNVAECFSVIWTFPDANANTMIVPMTSTAVDAVPQTPDVNGQFIYTGVNKVGFTIKKHLNNTATQNTIRLDIVKDGLNYSAFVQPIFGTAGTNGSDYTLVLTWLNGKNAIDITETPVPMLKGELALFDQAGNTVEWPAEAIVSCDWQVAYVQGGEPELVKDKEEADIFYPVFTSTNEAILYGNNNNPEREDQPDGFYYFIDTAAVTGAAYYTFNYHTQEFVPTNYSNSGNLYRKCLNDNEKKNKLDFRRVTFNEDPLNQATGEITNANSAITLENNEKVYHYSQNQRYFVKIDNRYILDPWSEYQEVETYYEPIEAKARTEYPGVLNVEAGMDEDPANVITIYKDENHSINMNSLFVLQVTLSNFGDYDLVTYYPIPIKDSSVYNTDYIEGPDRVRYTSSGTLDYNKNPYQITAHQRDAESNMITYRHGYPEQNNVEFLGGYWKLLIADPSELYFYPVLNETAIDETADPPKIKEIDPVDPQYDIPLLSPISVYIPDATAYGVQFYGFYYTLIPNAEAFATITNIYNADGELQSPKPTWDTSENAVNNFYQKQVYIMWTQPILVYESRYPSQTLNKWNGRDIQTDEEAGTILASGFAAGKKERDNTFTGVVLGDWSRSIVDSAISKNTGIYGFHRGAMAYAFKDDGTGFIGKDGSGRIYLDGDKSQIFSSKWANKNNNESAGMLLDIDDGFIKMKSIDPSTQIYSMVNGNIEGLYFTGANYTYPENASPQLYKKLINGGYSYSTVQAGETYDDTYYYYVLANGTRYITLGANQPYTPLSIGTSENVSSRNFRVNWDGALYAADGDFQGNIHGSYISGSVIRGTRVYADYLEANVGEIAGWVMNHDEYGDYLLNKDTSDGIVSLLHSRSGINSNRFVVLRRNGPTNYTPMGTIGELEGEYDDVNSQQPVTTTCLGIRNHTSTHYSIVLEAMHYANGASDNYARNIRISGRYGYNCNAIYLRGRAIDIGYFNTDWQNNSTLRYAGITQTITLTAENLVVDVDKNNQTGIYARFA